MAKRKRKTKNDKYYINNKEMLEEIIKSKKQGRMTERFGEMIMILARRYSSQGSYASYTYREDMESYAFTIVCRGWDSFDPESYNNPFAYFTQTVKRAFWQFLDSEKSQRNIKDALLLKEGELPSHTYEEDFRETELEEAYLESVSAKKITDRFYNLLMREIAKVVEDKEATRSIHRDMINTILKKEKDRENKISPYEFIRREISDLSAIYDPTYRLYDGDEYESE